MTMELLTVVIPTYNRAEVLKEALNGYALQSEPMAIRELIVVDDGSQDETESVVQEAARISPFPVLYLHQDNQGPAAARNYGIREASSPIILFTDSDIVPDRDMVSQHLQWHTERREESVGVLGRVWWPKQPKPTPFMRWYGEQGPLFSYGKFRHGQELGPFDLYTCNVSLKTNFLRTYGTFDEEFKRAAYEDTELGFRLKKCGLRLYYNSHAAASHLQFYSFDEVCRRIEANRASATVFFKREAGRVYLEHQNVRKSRVSYRMARVVATVAGAVFSPAKRFMDSGLRFPNLVYRLIFWYHTTRQSNRL